MNNNMGTYDFIGLDYIVSGAKMKLGIRDYTIDDIFLKDIANRGVKRMRIFGTMVHAIAQLEIIGLKAKVPKGFIRTVSKEPIVFVDATGNIVSGNDPNTIIYATGNVASFGYPIPANDGFFKNNPNSFSYQGNVQIENGYICFGSDITAQYFKLAYLSANIDPSGQILIPSFCEDTLMAFICWEYTRSNVDKYGNMYQSYEVEWKNGKAYCRGLANLPSSLNYSLANYIMLSLI